MFRFLLITTALLCSPTTLRAADPKKAEPFEDALREAVKDYRAGKLDQVRADLAKAADVLEKARAGMVVDTFPDPPKGWKVGDVEKADIPALLGGGRTVKRVYSEKDGKKEILLEVIYDSSFGKLVMGLMANDAVAESQGFKVKRIGSERALFKGAKDGGELNVPIEERLLIKLTGKGGAEEKDLLALAREIDRTSLKHVK